MTYPKTAEGTARRRAAYKRWYNKSPANVQKVLASNKLRVRGLKQTLVNALGGKCNKCGYNRCIGALDFHHRGQKDTNISALIHRGWGYSRIIGEARKCTLLCSNCHREHHFGRKQKTHAPKAI